MSRRLHSLLYSPRLLQSVDVNLEHPSMEGVRALFSWLVQRCAGRMEALRMRLVVRALPAAEQAEVAAQLPAKLAVCGTAGDLARLRPRVTGMGQPALVVGSWAAAVSRLQQMDLINDNGTLRVSAPLHSLTMLRDLLLLGRPVLLSPSAVLPTSLTRLTLGGNAGATLPANADGLPPQVRCLACGHHKMPTQPIHAAYWDLHAACLPAPCACRLQRCLDCSP